MKIAVTAHAVDRYVDRVEGAKGFHRESVREAIRLIVEEGFSKGIVRNHPLHQERRVIPFKSGDSVLFLSLGPNMTDREGELAVIGVLFEKELSEGRVSMGVTLGDLFPNELFPSSGPKRHRYLLFIGDPRATVERYFAEDEIELREIVRARKPAVGEVTVYERIET